MKGKSYASRLGALALALTLATTSLIGGTLAKYATTVTGDGSATVAAWSFKAADAKGSETFKVVLTDDTLNNKVTDKMIAPGTDGSFNIALDGSGSDVALNYTIELGNIKNKPENLKFYSNAACSADKEIVVPSGESAKVKAFDGSINLVTDKTKMTATEIVYWKWAYGDTTDINTADTASGTGTDKGITFDIIVTGTQQDPTK